MKVSKGKKRKKWLALFKGKIEDFDPNLSLAYWRGKSTTEKFAEVQKLINHVKFLEKKEHIDGRKLLRTTAVIKRA